MKATKTLFRISLLGKKNRHYISNDMICGSNSLGRFASSFSINLYLTLYILIGLYIVFFFKASPLPLLGIRAIKGVVYFFKL